MEVKRIMKFSKVHLKKWCRRLAGILALLIVAHPAAPSFAAPIYHKHTASCYQVSEHVCSNHRFEGVTEQPVGVPCPHCFKSGHMLVIYYMYTCTDPKSGYSPVYNKELLEGERRGNYCGCSF